LPARSRLVRKGHARERAAVGRPEGSDVRPRLLRILVEPDRLEPLRRVDLELDAELEARPPGTTCTDGRNAAEGGRHRRLDVRARAADGRERPAHGCAERRAALRLN